MNVFPETHLRSDKIRSYSFLDKNRQNNDFGGRITCIISLMSFSFAREFPVKQSKAMQSKFRRRHSYQRLGQTVKSVLVILDRPQWIRHGCSPLVSWQNSTHEGTTLNDWQRR